MTSGPTPSGSRPCAGPCLPVRFAILFLPLCLLVLGGLYAYRSLEASGRAEAVKARQMGRVSQEVQVLETALSASAADAAFLADMTSTLLREAGERAPGDIAGVLWSFAFVNRGYARIQYLDASGVEIARVNLHPQGPEMVPGLHLADRSTLPDFLETRDLPGGSVRVSRLELNAEDGRLDAPPTPVLRFSSPVFGPDGVRAGVVVLALKGDLPLERLRLASSGPGGAFLMANAQGYWLLGPSPDSEWAFQLDGRPEGTLKQLWPGAWETARRDGQGQIPVNGGLLTFDTVTPGQGYTLGADLRVLPAEDWLLAVHTSEDSFNPPTGPLFWFFNAGLAALLAVVSWLWAQARLRRDQAEARLREMATIDGLTRLFNRRHFLETGQTELERARRYGRALSLVMFDVDHFKKVNDTYGHDAGDAVLRSLADTARTALRQADVLGRLGGEEFAAILPETDLKAGMETAERLRRAVEELKVSHGELVLRLTVSLGVAQIREGEDLDGLLKRADQALYEAKNSGRNRSGSAGS
ncbi:diguanylate cyclase [Desulfovibrio aminophilus]|uniref:sensor domain-containing diguanylate cyclase n=1 Tax=Desulfovibrio aminophilus TaxID=81425 RepID=UPI0033949E31